MSARFGGATEICPVCDEKVYAMDRFVIEKMVIHKGCFKCKHCGSKLGLGNFAAVNQQVYCKTHYLQLFRESGGRYDKAFGGGGFERNSTEVGYTPGQFKGIGAPTTTGAGAGPKVKEVMKKFQDTASPTHAAPPKPKEVISPVKPLVVEPEDNEQNTSFESVSSRKSAYLAAVGNDAPTAAGQGNFKRTASTDNKKNAYLAAMAQTNNGGVKQVDTNTAGLSISERIKLYNSSASNSSSSLKDTSSAAVPEGISKLSDRLQQYQNAVASTKEDDDDEEQPQQQQDEEPEQYEEEEQQQDEEPEQYEEEEQQEEEEYQQEEEAQEEVPVS